MLPTPLGAEWSTDHELRDLVAEAWDAWDNAAETGTKAAGSMPILYFGDLPAYENSPLRVVTVGLNPSHREFPAGGRSRGFPRAVGVDASDSDLYLQALNEYFRGKSYAWFSEYEKVLRGAGVSYKPGAASTALHTDICSPVATDPTWTHLDRRDKERLLEFLRPEVIVMSVALEHVARVKFPQCGDSETVRNITHKRDGTPRKRPYEVKARWHAISGHPAMLIFGHAAQTPFGAISDPEKHSTGECIKAHYDSKALSQTTR